MRSSQQLANSKAQDPHSREQRHILEGPFIGPQRAFSMPAPSADYPNGIRRTILAAANEWDRWTRCSHCNGGMHRKEGKLGSEQLSTLKPAEGKVRRAFSRALRQSDCLS